MIEEIALESGGLRFRALAAGPAGGRRMLLLHGFPEGAESWQPQLEALAEAGVRALAPDLRGYGGSDAPAGEDHYAYPRLVEDVLGFAAWFGGGPIHLAGHDWGSAIGWAAVSAHPELFASWTALSVPHPADLERARAEDPDQRQRSAYIELFLVRGKAEEVLSADGFRRLRAIFQGVVPSEVVERYVEGMARPGRLTAALDYYRANFGRPAFDGLRLPVRVPTLMVWGDSDVAVGRLAVEAGAARVEAPYRLEVLAGAGHWLQFDRAAEVSGLLVAQATSS